ncbi:MAG: nitroreductase [Erysipelotrichaceae bacterium]|nr:nitroreductase [Erysipelotrichaceae bacterium]
MNTNKKILELIPSRISIRTYDPKPISQIHLNQMTVFLDELNKQAQSKIRFSILSTQMDGKETNIKLGSYGVLSGTHTYLVSVLHEKEGNALELGYLFEKAILKATDLGLGTCWLGGTFKREDFEKNTQLNDHEYIPIVSSLGYIKDKRSLIESAMRFGVGANNRKAWDTLFFLNDDKHPLSKIDAGDYEKVLEMVRVGPSASNKQPWRIVKQDKFFHFYCARNPGYGDMMKYDLQMNDIGIAKCHFELSATELGLNGSWIITDHPSLGVWEYVLSWEII